MQDTRLDRLMTYTTFHIGLYVTLITAVMAAGISGALDKIDFRWVQWVLGCFIIAGLSGAIVGSNLPEAKKTDSFLGTGRSAGIPVKRIGFWRIPIMPPQWWIHLEHFAFWAGLLPVVLSFVIKGPDAFKQAPPSSPPKHSTPARAGSDSSKPTLPNQAPNQGR